MVSNSLSKCSSQILITNTGFKYWFQILVPSIGLKHWSQIPVPNPGFNKDPKYWLQIVLPNTAFKLVSKVGDRSRERPKCPSFQLLLYWGVREGATLFPGLLYFTSDPYLIMPSVKQGGIKYHFWVFGMTRHGIGPKSPGPLANTLHIQRMVRSQILT